MDNHEVLPLELKQKGDFRFFKLHHLYPLAHGPNDFFLLPKGQLSNTEAAEQYFNHLDSIKETWDYLHLFYIPESSNVWEALSKIFQENNYNVKIRRHRHFYFIDTTESWEDYYESFLHKSLRDVRGRFNRLKKAGLSYEIHEVTNGIYEYLPHLLELYDKRRQSTDQKNAFLNNSHRKLLEEIIPVYEAKGWLKLSYIRGSDNKIWAYQLDFLKDGIQYHYTPSFDEDYKFYSPSKILLFESIKSAFLSSDINEFNFMRGESPYKTQYAREKEDYIFLDIKNNLSKRNRFADFITRISSIKAKLKMS